MSGLQKNKLLSYGKTDKCLQPDGTDVRSILMMVMQLMLYALHTGAKVRFWYQNWKFDENLPNHKFEFSRIKSRLLHFDPNSINGQKIESCPSVCPLKRKTLSFGL